MGVYCEGGRGAKLAPSRGFENVGEDICVCPSMDEVSGECVNLSLSISLKRGECGLRLEPPPLTDSRFSGCLWNFAN